MTRGEYVLAVRARRRAEDDHAVRLAYAIDNLRRAKRLPTLKKLLTPKKRFTPARVARLRADFEEIEAQMKAQDAAQAATNG
jgi:hypothetical protein